MSDIYDKVRMVVAKMPDEKWPIVVGACPESTWEVIDPEEWDKIKRGMAEKWLGPDWTHYEVVEAIVTVPAVHLAELFAVREMPAEKVEAAR